MVRQVLMFGKGAHGERVVLQPRHVIREVLNIANETFPKSIRVDHNTPKDLWTVLGDATQLHQVLLNLCVNARDSMPDGGVLTISAENTEFNEELAKTNIDAKPGKYVVITVSDTGSGIPPGLLDKIFEPFFTTKEVGKGTGLGLATVYGIVKQSGGHILVYSEPGQGTTFKIYLPSADHKIGVKSEPEAETIGSKRQGITILLVEDDEIMRSLTRQLLQEQGYTVFEASDGNAALEWVESHPGQIDLLLTDVVMRRMSGPELVERLHSSHPSLKVVYMSGYTGELIAERQGLKPGLRLLEKPFTRTALLNTIHSTLR